MHVTHPDTIGAGILASRLARELEEVIARPPAENAEEYVDLLKHLDSLWEELALFFDAEGTGTPELARFHDHSSQRLHEAYSIVETLEETQFMRSCIEDALRGIVEKSGAHRRDLAEDVTVTLVAKLAGYDRHDSFEILLYRALRLYTVVSVENLLLARMPHWLAGAAIDSLVIDHAAIMTEEVSQTDAETALTLWEPQDICTLYAEFTDALDAARRL